MKTNDIAANPGSAVFLKAEWRNLLMANYAVDPALLKSYLPCRTELDDFNGVHYVSLVGFLFCNTRVKGIAFPFHTKFEEVNLRFYVRFKEGNQWKRGVVFMREIVPKRMISFIANSLYGENYVTRPMNHRWQQTDEGLEVEYAWKVNGGWNYIKATAERDNYDPADASEETFITEHYWGYTQVSNSCTGAYEVRHPKWKVRKVHAVEVNVNAELVYGPAFATVLQQAPGSVFLAEGSPIEVLKGSKIYSPAI